MEKLLIVEGDELFEIEADECDVEADGFWLDDESDDSQTFYEFCEVDLDDYDLE